MNRLEFMQQLEALLSDISQGEREEALQYYNDYLNDAGVENEQEVLDARGSPEQLAKVIKEGLEDNGAEGEFTETGYHNEAFERKTKNEVVKKEEKKRLSGGMIAILILLCILAMPMLAALLSGLFGAGIGVLGGFIGLLLGTAAVGIGLFIGAIVLLGIGIGELFVAPLIGMCLIGAGILLLGLSIFFIWITVWLWGSALPWLIRKAVDLFSRILHGKRGEKA